MRTQSKPCECYYDRNLLIQCLAIKMEKEGADVFVDFDNNAMGYVVLCIQINAKLQLSFHLPNEELILNIPKKIGRWIPMDVSDRRMKLLDVINNKI